MSHDDTVIRTSFGQKLAGRLALLFGATMQLIAAFGFILSLVAGIMWLVLNEDMVEILPFLVLLALSVVMHVSGQVMIYTGDYLLGKTRGLGERALLLMCSRYIVRDISRVMAAILFLLAATALAGGRMAEMVVLAVLCGGCGYLIWWVNKLPRAMSQP
ncbi:hypothetical protein NT6N_18860 [Oceaniferula spumae]|uniref:Uncharacterized protein n=1 Tax=Oceaniferula spumae TaxID=2979115 RepID=A0AAT9FLJ1_9BACT